MHNRSSQETTPELIPNQVIPDLFSDDIIDDSPMTGKHLVSDYTEIIGTDIPLPEQTESKFLQKTRELIQKADAARNTRGQFGGLTLGSERFYEMNNLWGGIDVGVHLVAADSNVGKSSLLRMLAWDIIRFNKNVHVRFYTLDDAEQYFFDSFCAQAAKVPINAIHKPEAYIERPEGYHKRSDYKRQVERGTEMYQKFLRGDYLDKFSFAGADSLQSSDWETISADIKQFKGSLPKDVQLVVIVDNFHDIEISGMASDINSRTEEVAARVDRLAKEEQIIFLGSAELKKNQQRRPILDDICGSRKWKYKARTVLLLYSEVGVSRPNPRIYYERSDKPGEQSAVLEIHFAKSKVSEFKGRLFAEQVTEMGWVRMCTPDEAKQYAMLIS